MLGQMDLSPSTRGNVQRALEASTWLFQIRWIWYVSTNSSGGIFWIQKIFCSMMRWHSYVGMPVLTYDASAIRQDPDLFLSEADLKDPVVPVYHHHTPAIDYLANHAT
jgi:hypothetical protein